VSPVSFEPCDEQLTIQNWIHGFAADVMRPAAPEWDRREEFPWPIIEAAASIGLYSKDFLIDTLRGDPSGLTAPIALEEMSWGDAGITLCMLGSSLAASAILGNGTKLQKEEWVPQCYGTSERIQLGAFCVSEADAGSDVSALKTRAEYDERTDEWVLNGAKAWITNGGIANVHIVVASIEANLGSRGQASFVIPPGTPGLSQGQKYMKLGIRASHTAEVVLDDVRVPGHCLLGGKERLDEKLARYRERSAAQAPARQPAMATFEATRPGVAAQAVGVARAAFEYALEYALERKAFGKAIGMHEGVGFILSDMATEIDAARLLVWRAAWLARNGGFKRAEGSMSKLKAGRTAVSVTERALQILAGHGYVSDHPVEQWYRDAKIFDIFEGTEQIQQLVIARALTGMRVD